MFIKRRLVLAPSLGHHQAIIIIIIMFHKTFIFAYQALIHPHRNVKNTNYTIVTLIHFFNQERSTLSWTQYSLTWVFLPSVHVVFSFVSHVLLLVLSCLVYNCCWLAVCIVVVVLCVLLSSYVYLLYCVCIAVFTVDAGLLARSQYSEGPATGHLDTGFTWFPCVYKQMLRWFPTFQVATTCFSCSPPDLNLVVTNFMFCLHVK